jgi:hypothetical protein
MTDGRYFAWVRRVCPWVEPKLYPQVIVDTEMAGYQISLENKQAKLDIVVKRVLTFDEYGLSINELVKKYPAPEGYL